MEQKDNIAIGAPIKITRQQASNMYPSTKPQPIPELSTVGEPLKMAKTETEFNRIRGNHRSLKSWGGGKVGVTDMVQKIRNGEVHIDTPESYVHHVKQFNDMNQIAPSLVEHLAEYRAFIEASPMHKVMEERRLFKKSMHGWPLE